MRGLLVAAVAVLGGCEDVRLAPPVQDDGGVGDRRVCASGPTLEGVDVSKWDDEVDWDRVAASGRAFGIARVSDGTTYVDGTFDDNWRGMADAGLVRGAYQYFRPGQSAAAQADLVIDAVTDLGPGDLPPVIDVETSDGQSSATITAGIRTWLDRVEAATGVTPMIYAASGFWDTLSNTGQFAGYPLWVANYGATCPSMPDTWDDWAIWQYTDSGSVPGISGAVDLDEFQGTMGDLESMSGFVGDPMEIAWDEQSDGSFTFHAWPRSNVVRVEYRVDGYLVGAADATKGAGFPIHTVFSLQTTSRLVEATGYDASGERVARGVGLMDTVPGTGVFIRQVDDDAYEVGLEDAPAAVAAIEVTVDGMWTITDDVSHTTHSQRLAVLHTYGTLGTRDFAVDTYNTDGTHRGTLHRTFRLE